MTKNRWQLIGSTWSWALGTMARIPYPVSRMPYTSRNIRNLSFQFLSRFVNPSLWIMRQENDKMLDQPKTTTRAILKWGRVQSVKRLTFYLEAKGFVVNHNFDKVTACQSWLIFWVFGPVCCMKKCYYATKKSVFRKFNTASPTLIMIWQWT